jgi:N-methylhydantoinase B
VSAEATGIGWGASRTDDGESGMVSYGGGDLKNYPIEVMESRYPIRVTGYGLEPDSGGPGKRRGGLAIWRGYEFYDDTAHLSLWLERSVTGPWGLFGGKPGRVPATELQRPGMQATRALKCSHVPTPSGSTLQIVTGGGGGYGDPHLREPELVAEDLLDGYITEGAARDLYGYTG